MKHKFLLDENILYYAVKGIDVQGKSDPTATKLVRLIGRNCHRIVIDPELAGKYAKHLEKLKSVPRPALQPSEFLNEFLLNELKTAVELYAPVELPQGVRFPPEDIHILKLAVRSGAVVVTEDVRLRADINEQPAIGRTAIPAKEAIKLAEDT